MPASPASCTRRAALKALAALGAAPAALSARADPLLGSTATIVTGFPAGGSADVTARVLAEKLRGRLAPTVIVENRPGAGGRLAVEHAKGLPADGSGLLLTPQGMMALFPHIYRRLPYDPLNDFAPVTLVVKFPFVVAIGPLVPADVRTLDHFVAWCRAQPGQASFGSPGEGTSAHFAGVMLGQSGKFPLTHVPYKGMAPLVQDLAGGQVAAGILTMADVAPVGATRRLRVLASTGSARSAYLPQAPTLAELGHPSVAIDEMYGIFAPAATPGAVNERIAEMVAQTLALPDVKSRLAQLYLETVGSPPAQFKAFMQARYDFWAAAVKSTRFTPTE